jgi:tRNA threonylcarbamoyladenosine biosynthesis protein TsaE
MKWIIDGLDTMEAVAFQFLDYVGDRTIFALYGQMGVGKTTFVKAIAAVLGVGDEVSSPTFAIVNEYAISYGQVLYHFDFYRVNEVSEAMDFGYEEYFYSGCKCFIEWPEKIEEILPEDVVRVTISENEDSSRTVEISAAM